MLIGRGENPWRGLDVSVHPSADADPGTLSVQENADAFIDGAIYQRTGTKQLTYVWNGLLGSESDDLETSVAKGANIVRTMIPPTAFQVETTTFPSAPED